MVEEEQEEEEETDYETDKQIEASGFSRGLRPWWVFDQPLRWLGKQELHPFAKVNPKILVKRLELVILETNLGMMDYIMKC